MSQEYVAIHDAVWPEQSVDSTPTNDGSTAMSAPAIQANARQRSKRAANGSQYEVQVGLNTEQVSYYEFLTSNSRFGGCYVDLL